MKTCRECLLLLPSSEYQKNKNIKSGLHSYCKKCSHAKALKRRRTEKTFITNMYCKQRIRSREQHKKPIEYTQKELTVFLSTHDFSSMFKDWVASNYLEALTPSIDRLDDYKGYSLSNIQLITWDENRKKAGRDKEKWSQQEELSQC